MEKRLRWSLSNIVVVETLLKLYVVTPATVQYHITFTFTSVVHASIQRFERLLTCLSYVADIDISSYDAVGNNLRSQMFGIPVLLSGTGVLCRAWLNPLYCIDCAQCFAGLLTWGTRPRWPCKVLIFSYKCCVKIQMYDQLSSMYLDIICTQVWYSMECAQQAIVTDCEWPGIQTGAVLYAFCEGSWARIVSNMAFDLIVFLSLIWLLFRVSL